MVQPQNIGSAVEEFLSLLHLDPHQEFVLEQNDPGIPPPSSLTHIPQFVIVFSEFFMCRLTILQSNTDSFIFLPRQMSPSPPPSPPPAPYITSHLTTWTSSQSPDVHSSLSFATSQPVTWRERNWKNSPALRDRWEVSIHVHCN